MTFKDQDVQAWLVDGDPSVRWQALRDLGEALPEEVAAARAQVAEQGWGSQLLAARDSDGQWAGGACFPKGFDFDFSKGQPWTATMPTLGLLRRLGVDPHHHQVRETIALIKDSCRWEHDGQAFFHGEVEPCINGQTLAVGRYFGAEVDPILERLLGEQLEDGGWNCEAENGSVRSSFHSTICVLEGLLEHEQQLGGSPVVTAARCRGEDYLLARGLMRRQSTGEIINPDFLRASFPPQWHYDVLRALDYFRATGQAPDSRLDEAVALVRSARQPDGTWLLDGVHAGEMHVEIEQVGEPSRWNTLRALRVLAWYDA